MKNVECFLQSRSWISLNLSIECSESFHRIDWRFPLILLKSRALNEIIASLRHRNAEPSPFR